VLQDQAPALDIEEMRVVFENDFQTTLESVFKEFDPEAIAAASLAQVHRAVLKNGDEVAVKLQFPALRTQYMRDMSLIQILVKTGDWILNLNDFNDIDFFTVVKTFRKSLENELDFRKEVSNGIQCAKNFAQYDDIYIPKYFKKYCSKRVITMEFVRGVRINDAEGQKNLGVNPLDSAAVLNRAMAEMVFKHGHVHCDAHPGNILIRNHPTQPNKPQLILLDHGMYRHYSKAFLHLYARLFLATIS
jgi:aarF domain-containing kinase